MTLDSLTLHVLLYYCCGSYLLIVSIRALPIRCHPLFSCRLTSSFDSRADNEGDRTQILSELSLLMPMQRQTSPLFGNWLPAAWQSRGSGHFLRRLSNQSRYTTIKSTRSRWSTLRNVTGLRAARLRFVAWTFVSGPGTRAGLSAILDVFVTSSCWKTTGRAHSRNASSLNRFSRLLSKRSLQ